MSAAGKLKPCPFCGGKAAIQEGGDWPEGRAYWVKCVDCDADGQTLAPTKDQIAGEKAAAILWNTRSAAAPKPDNRVLACIKACDSVSTKDLDAINQNGPGFLAMKMREADVLQLMSTQLQTQRNDLAEAARSCVAAFEDLFGQCCSNPVKNAWGKQVDFTKLNDANQLAQQSLRRLKGLVE